MGFEQLAALRDQLAAERAAREGKTKHNPDNKTGDGDKKKGPRKPQSAKPGDSAGKPARPAGKPGATRPDRPPRKPEQAAPQEPRDPVLVAIGRLQHAFPKAFPKKPAPRVPLKLGIVEDLYAHAAKLRLDEAAIKAAIAVWCGAARYWAALAKDAVRVDLNGEPSGTVTAAEAGHANFLARQQRKKAQAAKKATEAAAPDAPTADAAAASSTDAPAADVTDVPAGETEATPAAETSVEQPAP